MIYLLSDLVSHNFLFFYYNDILSRLLTRPTKWHVLTAKTRMPRLIRVFTVYMKKHWVLSYPMSAQWRLIRLGGCPGWSESSLGCPGWSESSFGAKVILLVLSQGGSFRMLFTYNAMYLSLVTRKPAFRVCDQVRHKPACTAPEVR